MIGNNSNFQETDIKKTFLKYEKVRRSGKYNMITEAATVMKRYHIYGDIYSYVIIHYSELYKQFINK